MRLVIFGRQGAGKGTQCKVLAAHYGAPHVSTGDMLREAVAEGTDFGRKAKEYLDNGELLPDDIMLGVIEDRLHKADVLERGFLLDGYPRTVGQAEALIELERIDVAVNLEVPEELVLQRLSSRRICRNGHIYSVGDESIASGQCPVDDTEVVQREDDTPEAITTRLEAYATKTMQAISWFETKDLLLTVDGIGTPDEVSARLIASIDACLAG